MESMHTMRLDSVAKEQGAEIMRRLGAKPLRTVCDLPDCASGSDALPFVASGESSEADVTWQMRAFEHCHTKVPLSLTDDELREERLKARYGTSSARR